MNVLKRWIFLKLSTLLSWLSEKPKACELTGKLVLKVLAKQSAKKSEQY